MTVGVTRTFGDFAAIVVIPLRSAPRTNSSLADTIEDNHARDRSRLFSSSTQIIFLLLAMRSLVSRKKNSARPSSRTEEGCRTAAIKIETASRSFPDVTFPMPQRGPHRESDVTILPIKKRLFPEQSRHQQQSHTEARTTMRTTKPRFVGRGGRKGWPEWVVAGRVVGTGHPRLPQKAGTDRQQSSRKADHWDGW